jgi:hypothetical protein
MVAKYAKECALLRKKDMRFVDNLFLDFSIKKVILIFVG